MIGMLQTQDERYGYNLTSGGDGVSGFHHTDESKIRMSVAKQGAKHPNYGKHLTSATREKIASRLRGNKNCLGVVRSIETRHRMSVSKSKPVEMRSDGVLLRVFSSAKQAEAETGISRKNISLCCLNQRKHAGSYEWNFA